MSKLLQFVIAQICPYYNTQVTHCPGNTLTAICFKTPLWEIDTALQRSAHSRVTFTEWLIKFYTSVECAPDRRDIVFGIVWSSGLMNRIIKRPFLPQRTPRTFTLSVVNRSAGATYSQVGCFAYYSVIFVFIVKYELTGYVIRNMSSITFQTRTVCVCSVSINL